MDSGASGAWRAARSVIHASSVHANGAGSGTTDAVAGATSVACATGSAFNGSSAPPAPTISYW